MDPLLHMQLIVCVDDKPPSDVVVGVELSPLVHALQHTYHSGILFDTGCADLHRIDQSRGTTTDGSGSGYVQRVVDPDVAHRADAIQ